jgi:hypothetical protein
MKVKHRYILAFLLVTIAAGTAYNRRRAMFRAWNVAAILSEGLDGRLIPHRVNRLAVLDEVLDRGLRSMEVDVLFRPATASTGYFEVGHDDNDARGVRLDAFLDRMQAHAIGKIWLDVKNLNPTNLESALTELRRLDELYGLRKIAIIEYYKSGAAFAAVSGAGFHSSYYVPEDRIDDLLAAGDVAALTQSAQAIAATVKLQAVDAVSFRLTIYPFVKRYLEPMLPPATRYHAWDSVELRRWRAIDKLQASDYYGDPRLETILYRL